jgi:hypothetical protein
MKTKTLTESCSDENLDPVAQKHFQTLDEFQREYFPNDFQSHTSAVDSSEAFLRELAQQSSGIIKAAFAENQ